MAARACVQDRVVLHPCTAYTNLQSVVQSTLYTFSLGQPALHTCVVRTSDGQHFACAWQATLRHMHSLETQRATPEPDRGGPSTARRDGPSAAQGSSEDALARARAAVGGLR